MQGGEGRSGAYFIATVMLRWLTEAQKPTPNSQSQFRTSGLTASSSLMPEPLKAHSTGRQISAPAIEMCSYMVTGWTRLDMAWVAIS